MSRQVDVKSLVSHIVRGDGLDKCRICMGDTSQGQVHLTDTVMMDGDKAVTLSELLEVITGVEIIDDNLCPNGVCVTCASAALAAEEFRLFVINAEKMWNKTLSTLKDLPLEYTENAKSICAFLTQNDLTMEIYKDFSGGEPETVVNRTKAKVNKKLERKPRVLRGNGPMTTCPDCHKCFANPHLLHTHLLNSDQKTVCLTCGVVLAKGADMKLHMETVHKETPHLCKQCPTLHNTEADLAKHVKKAHKPGAFTCSACGRTFLRKASFDTHAQMHLVRTCRACGTQFTNRSCYREHRSVCEPDAKPSTKAVPRNRRSNLRDPGNYICDYCDKTYLSRPQLKNHILWIHLDHRPHQCSWCGKRFFTSARLNEHTVVHTRVRNFECDICGAKLVSKSAVIYHRRRHTGEKPYVCDDCGVAFISSSRRSEHAKRKHNKGVRLPCPDCPATFVRKMELKKHSDKVHKKDRIEIEVPALT